MPDLRTFPYRRDLRPPNVEGLGEHVDREFEKIESVISAYETRVAALEARLAAAGIP